MKAEQKILTGKYTYEPIEGGYRIINGKQDYVRPLYAPHVNDRPGGNRYIYYVGDRPRLVVSDADQGSTADNGSIGRHMVRYGHLFLGILNGENSKWLEEMEHIEARYLYGREEYDIEDPSFAGCLKLTFVRPADMDGILIKAVLPEGLRDKFVVAAAGQKGAPGAQPVAGKSERLFFRPEDTEYTTIYLEEKGFLIADNVVDLRGASSVKLCFQNKNAACLEKGPLALLDSEPGRYPAAVGVTAGNEQEVLYLMVTTEEKKTIPRILRRKQKGFLPEEKSIMKRLQKALR